METILFLLAVLLVRAPVITEVASNPLVETSGEFIELFNPDASPVSIAGYSVTDGDALDFLLPWDESIHGPFPHAGMVLGTDTIPAEGFALLFELDYAGDGCYDIPPGTVILTTGDHAICNGLAASSDPVTLFDAGGTADSNAVSTYGTPVPSDIWQERDDDGLDGIPFDPGDNITVERYPWSSPDTEGAWFAGPEGGTPGAHAQAPPDTLNVSCDSLWTVPVDPLPGQPFEILAQFTCWGNVPPSSGTITIFLDSEGDSIPGTEEVLAQYPATALSPGTSLTFSAFASLEQGWYLPSALSEVPEDEYPQDDFRSLPVAVGGGIDPVVTEVMCNPLDEDRGEYIEIFYPGPGIFPLCGCRFTDGDAVDIIVPWDQLPLTDPDAVYSEYLPGGIYGVVLDPDYVTGMQEYDLAESTYVFTVGNTTIGNGLSGNDPITLYDFQGTAQANVMSTYGTPLCYDDPLMCDDDGLDGIPFDPGEFHSVERKSYELPDEEYCWAVSPEGGTPGGPAVFFDTLDVSVDTILIDPDTPQPGQPVQLAAVISNRGTVTATGSQVTIFLDSDADSLPQPSEILLCTVVDSLLPACTDTVPVTVPGPEEGYYLAAALVDLPGDTDPDNDFANRSFRTGNGIPLTVTEVLCNPENEDTDEFVEVYYPGPGVFDVTGCSFTDGDALDWIQPWDQGLGTINDPDAVISPYLPAGTYAVILDSEYTQGTQPYDFPPGTRVLTTGNTTLGDGLTGTDPITLYDHEGTSVSNIMSTYGTPVLNDDPLLCDDDGLDGIPFDPGEDLSVHRIDPALPDAEENWFAPPTGPTPGGPPPFFQEGMNACGLLLDCFPPMGHGGQGTDLTAGFVNTGTDTIPSGTMQVLFFADIDQSGTPAQGELIDSFICGSLPPGDSLMADCGWTAPEGPVDLISVSVCPGDSFPQDDTLTCTWNLDGPVVVNEIMYAPAPGEPEWIEILNRSEVPVEITGWTTEDSKDRVVFCQDSLVLQPDSFALIVPDSDEFLQFWPQVACPLLQPASWPVLNNTTQSGEEWADIIIVRDAQMQPVDYVPYDDDWGASQGASLERIDPDQPGFPESNWTGCSTTATPGETNSCAGGGEGPGRYLHYFPDPFSPDGDGMDDRLTIEMYFGHSENEVTLEVYNVQGRLILRLLDRETCGPSRTVFWDGTGEDGSRLPVGRYIIYLSSRAEDTGEYREDCGVVVLARHL